MSDITVILNGYKRPHNLDEQIVALGESTIKPEHIMLWYNNPGGNVFNTNAIQSTRSAISNVNWGVWARFFYALNARTKYVCVLDDDTIPGARWLENCMNTMATHRGLLGTVGLIYPPGADHYHAGYVRTGWVDANPDVRRVDFVGHSWFFEREWLSALTREIPDFNVFSTCGEDMHFSYALKKYYDINTYVPPHPAHDRSLWGSLRAHELGDDMVASWRIAPNQQAGMSTYFKLLRSRGWKLVSEE